jgi:purine-binding chemotaxis protein CheW
MSNTIINKPPANSTISKTRQIAPSLKLIVFSMGALNLALRIESIYKVVNHTATYSSGLNHIGVTHLENSEVTVVDLHRRFFQSSQFKNTEQEGYLIVVKNTTGEFYGIPVVEAPVLTEVPLSMIRVLPESYRRSDTLEVASHVAVIPQEGSAPLTVFFLDVDLLLPMFQELKSAKS